MAGRCAPTPSALPQLTLTLNLALGDGWQVCGRGSASTGVSSVDLDGRRARLGDGPIPAFHDPSGRPVLDGRKFPDLAGMVRRAHALGLKSGFYVNNCICAERGIGGAEAAERAMARTAEAIIALGFDSLKVDPGPQSPFTLTPALPTPALTITRTLAMEPLARLRLAE